MPIHAKTTIRPILLVPAALYSALFLLCLAHLQWQNARIGGALYFASDGGNFSAVENFLFRYLPTIAAVADSMVWNWIDLDIKRLES